MKTNKNGKDRSCFIILIPHRDALNHLAAYREKLFAAGFYGAYSFPAAAPLAELKRPLNREELKETAKNLRGMTGENEGKFRCGGTSVIYDAGKFSFLGLLLNLPAGEGIFPAAARVKVLKSFVPPLLCAALIRPDEIPPGNNSLFENAPLLSFRAAALANLAIRPLDTGEPNYSFKWNMSPPVWLPAYKK